MSPEPKCIDCGRALAYWGGRPATRCGECKRGRKRIKSRPQVQCVDCKVVFDPPSQTGALPLRCRSCMLLRKKQTDAEKARRWRDADPERKKAASRRANEKMKLRPDYKQYRRDKAIKSAYGISPIEYQAMLERQGGKCAICGGGPNGKGAFHVDHCHATKRVRGLLCHNCNTMLGLAADDPSRLEAAAQYLRKT